MSRRSVLRRTAVLVPITAAALVAGASPAGAILFEGDPGPASCLRVVPYPGTGPADNPLFAAHRYVAVLVPRAQC